MSYPAGQVVMVVWISAMLAAASTLAAVADRLPYCRLCRTYLIRVQYIKLLTVCAVLLCCTVSWKRTQSWGTTATARLTLSSAGTIRTHATMSCLWVT